MFAGSKKFNLEVRERLTANLPTHFFAAFCYSPLRCIAFAVHRQKQIHALTAETVQNENGLQKTEGLPSNNKSLVQRRKE